MKGKIEIRLAAVLLAIMLVSGMFLAAIYQVTLPSIRSQQEEEKEEAVVSVIPGADDYREVYVESLLLYQGLDRRLKPVGYAVKAEGSGFQGTITLMIGLDEKQRQVTGVEVLEMSETPGLGARIRDEWFRGQFENKSFDDPFVAGEDVDTISGATVSSEAVARLVKNTVQRFEEKELEQ